MEVLSTSATFNSNTDKINIDRQDLSGNPSTEKTTSIAESRIPNLHASDKQMGEKEFTFSDDLSPTETNVDKVSRQLGNSQKGEEGLNDEMSMEIRKLLNLPHQDLLPQEKEIISLFISLKKANPAEALKLIKSTNAPRERLNAVKVLALLENSDPSTLRKVLAISEDFYFILESGISYLKRQDISVGYSVAKAYRKWILEENVKIKSPSCHEALYLKGEKGYAAAHVQETSLFLDRAEFVKHITPALEGQNLEKQLERLKNMTRYAHGNCISLLLSTTFTSDPQNELIAKLKGFAKNINEEELTFFKKLNNNEQLLIQEALQMLNDTEPMVAKKVACKIFFYNATKLVSSLYEYCLELVPLQEQPFALKVSHDNFVSGNGLARGLILQALSAIKPDWATDILESNKNYNGYAILGLYYNRPAMRKILKSCLKRPEILREIKFVSGFQEPLNREVLKVVFEELEGLGLLKTAIGTIYQETSSCVHYLSTDMQEKVLKTLENSNWIPTIVAEIVYHASGPKWKDYESMRIQNFHWSAFECLENKFLRSLSFDHIMGDFFDELESKRALAHIKTPKQALEVINEFGKLLNSNLNGFGYDKNRTAKMEYPETFKEDVENFIQGLDVEFKKNMLKAGELYASLLKKLPVAVDLENLRLDLTNSNYLDDFFKMYLLKKMDSERFEEVVNAVHDHDFCLLILGEDRKLMETLVKNRMALFKTNQKRLEHFKRVFLILVPEETTERNDWIKFFDENLKSSF